jgi:hypothetical protein
MVLYRLKLDFTRHLVVANLAIFHKEYYVTLYCNFFRIKKGNIGTDPEQCKPKFESLVFKH